MINKTEALARLTALEAESAKLRKILETPDVTPSLLERKEDLILHYRIDGSWLAFTPAKDVANSLATIKGENYFESIEQATNYAKAFETFLLLRRQPGTVVPVQIGEQFVVNYRINGAVEPCCYTTIGYKTSSISPCFGTRANCEAAITAIGQTRLLHMFNTFHHIGA